MPQPSHSPSTLLHVKSLFAGAEDTKILKGISLEVGVGKVHAIMGPNGSGKSTLASILAGHPRYEISAGDIIFAGESILEMSPEERAALGIFLIFQYPAAIPGVPIHQFLRLSLNSLRTSRGEKPLDMAAFKKIMKQACQTLDLPWSFVERAVNDGFSGGEKKRLEALQMLVLQPKLIIMDEIDSGLDVDALRIIAQATNTLRNDNPDTTILLITHYQRILSLIAPDVVHVVMDGSVIETGGPELAEHIDSQGYKR